MVNDVRKRIREKSTTRNLAKSHSRFGAPRQKEHGRHQSAWVPTSDAKQGTNKRRSWEPMWLDPSLTFTVFSTSIAMAAPRWKTVISNALKQHKDANGM